MEPMKQKFTSILVDPVLYELVQPTQNTATVIGVSSELLCLSVISFLDTLLFFLFETKFPMNKSRFLRLLISSIHRPMRQTKISTKTNRLFVLVNPKTWQLVNIHREHLIATIRIIFQKTFSMRRLVIVSCKEKSLDDRKYIDITFLLLD